MNTEEDEFYIGYLGNLSKKIRRNLTIIIWILVGCMIVLASLLSIHQYRFVNSTFEYGTTTSIEGILFKVPIPHLVVQFGISNTKENLYKMIPLVGYGKMGALGLIEDIEQKNGKNLVGKRIKLIGSLIYYDGKLIMQILKEDNINIHEINYSGTKLNMVEDLGTKVVIGEIIDPKCYFGVMNPGYGKPHRSCAIRCISGGIPPVFYSKNDLDYYLLVNDNLQPLKHEVLNIIGDEVPIIGRELQLLDWKLLVVSDKEIKKVNKLVELRGNLKLSQGNIALCKSH